MAIYPLKCANGHHFDVIANGPEECPDECSTCGAPLARQWGGGVSVRFNGSGFHNTDYKRPTLPKGWGG